MMQKTKKLFIVSDIHGYFTHMKNSLDASGFDPKNPAHLLVCCGDYFDRGPENYNVLKYFDRLPHKVLLRGNHEDMLLKLLTKGQMEPHHYINGTLETISEFFGKYCLDPQTDKIDFTGKTRQVDRLTDFINETRNYFETENFVFVHGWLPTKVSDGKMSIQPDWRNASDEVWASCRWVKWTDMFKSCERLSGKTIVCGHVPSFFATKFYPERPTDDSNIFYDNDLIVVDAGTHSSGKINVLVLEDNLL